MAPQQQGPGPLLPGSPGLSWQSAMGAPEVQEASCRMRGAGDLDHAWVNRTKRRQERVSAGTPCGGSLTLGPNICLPWAHS